jgi:hypothetical protein
MDVPPRFVANPKYASKRPVVGSGVTTDVDGISTSLEISAGIPRSISTKCDKQIPGRLGILVLPRTETSRETHVAGVQGCVPGMVMSE